MVKKVTLVVATRNQGKIKEIRALLQDYPVTLMGLDDFGPIPEVEEDGETFDENAYKKASFAARVLGLPALADDSGLAVKALDGAPGVRSARYGGDASDTEKCHMLLDALKGITQREAAFECVISIAVPNGAALTYEGRCEGLITESLSGQNGFGYDPVFYYPLMDKTFAEMTREEKARVSHRGRALAEIRSEFEKVLAWIDIQSPMPVNLTDKEE